VYAEHQLISWLSQPQLALLNTTSMEYRFGHRARAIVALTECMRIAQVDILCKDGLNPFHFFIFITRKPCFG
jgi:hypothetical protein